MKIFENVLYIFNASSGSLNTYGERDYIFLCSITLKYQALAAFRLFISSKRKVLLALQRRNSVATTWHFATFAMVAPSIGSLHSVSLLSPVLFA
jgi:hypothetical protein